MWGVGVITKKHTHKNSQQLNTDEFQFQRCLYEAKSHEQNTYVVSTQHIPADDSVQLLCDPAGPTDINWHFDVAML